jgi:hypothetical protein
VLDLFWFGGVAQQGVDHSEVGRLGWDITDTPNVNDPYFPDRRAGSPRTDRSTSGSP